MMTCHKDDVISSAYDVISSAYDVVWRHITILATFIKKSKNLSIVQNVITACQGTIKMMDDPLLFTKKVPTIVIDCHYLL